MYLKKIQNTKHPSELIRPNVSKLKTSAQILGKNFVHICHTFTEKSSVTIIREEQN